MHLPKTGLNIDRATLPQVKSIDMPDYLRWLKLHKHISSIHTELPLNALMPSQGNFNSSKIHDFMTHKSTELRKPILVSSDHYVVDGHHRWIALLNLHPHGTIPVILMSAKILDLLAATKEYPKSFTKTVVESFKGQQKHAVIAYGRMNPPTKGHAQLINTVHQVAQKHGAHHEVILSHTQDSKKNPLSQENKHKYVSQMFPDTNFTLATPELPTIFHHATRLNREGYKHLHVVSGDDRTKEFEEKLHKYNGHYDDAGNGYKYDTITIHSSGARNPQSEGLEGMSGTKMRDFAAKGNYKEFSKGVPGGVDAKALYDDTRKGLTHLKEDVELLFEGVHDAGIFKVVFLAGAPGSGKDFVLRKALDGHGLTEINSDKALEHLMDKSKLDKKMPEHEQEKRGEIRDRAKSLTELRQRLALHGRNGIIINSTGAKVEHIKKIKKMLEDLGYTAKMVFVDTSDNVSRNRNVERGQRGGRMIPEKVRAEKWRQAQDSRVEFSKLFSGEHYHEFNNDEDLRNNTDGEVHKQKTKELDDLHKTVKKFAQQPPEHPAAQEWIYKNLGKLAKQPVGNKKQQSSQVPASSDSQATEEARKLGLQYYGYGRYGKSGHVTHFSLHGKLVEKKKALTMPKSMEEPKTPKKLNEAFEELLTEDTDEHLRLEDNVVVDSMVGGVEVVPVHVQHFTNAIQEHRSRIGASDRLCNLRDCGTQALKEEEAQKEKASFERFKLGLRVRDSSSQTKETLQEGEPTVDLGLDGGPLLGTRPAEQIDSSNGGVSTSGPKKTFKKLKTEIK